MKKIWIITECYYNDKDGLGQTMNVHSAYDCETKARSVFATMLGNILEEDINNAGLTIDDLEVEKTKNSLSDYRQFNYDSFHHDFKLEEIELK